MRFLAAVLSLVVSLNAQAEGEKYCLAIRGNGELAPAHWGAVANVVEKLGLPEKQAGGSSASITMLLLDAIATNGTVRQNPGTAGAMNAALLVKSLEGFADYLAGTPEFQDFIDVYMQARDVRSASWTIQLREFFDSAVLKNDADLVKYIQDNRDLLIRNFRTGMNLGLISERTQPQLFALGYKLVSAGEPLTGRNRRRRILR